ncbi:MAG: hypothetical protein ACK5MU_00590 [Candidatus Saccharimonadales bacterium]
MHIRKKEAERNENADLCGRCGGQCCKATPCTYFPSDFGEILTMDALLERIHAGKATLLRVEGCQSRVMTSRTRDHDGLDVISREEWVLNGRKIPYLRECALLTPTGCSLSLAERPSAGAMYVPRFICGVRSCYMPRVSVRESWDPYQPLLMQLEFQLLLERQTSSGRF